MVANKYAFLQITRRRFLNEWEAFKKVISRRNIRRRITIPLTLSNLKLLRDRKSGSAGMPRPISYAVFCLKKKKVKTGLPPAAHDIRHTKCGCPPDSTDPDHVPS